MVSKQVLVPFLRLLNYALLAFPLADGKKQLLLLREHDPPMLDRIPPVKLAPDPPLTYVHKQEERS